MTVLVRGVGAVLAVSSAVLHGASLSLPALAMAAACLYCAYELARFDSVRSWVLVAVMNIAMIGMHLAMTDRHHHDASLRDVTGEAPVHMGPAMGLATSVAAIEILLAATVLFVRTREPR